MNAPARKAATANPKRVKCVSREGIVPDNTIWRKDRIQGKRKFDVRGELVRLVEYCRPVHQELQCDPPQIVDVAEKHEEGGKDHADADVKQQQRRNRIREA